MSTRVETLAEVYEHQTGLVKGVAKEIARLRNGQEDKTEWAEEINGMADEQRVSCEGETRERGGGKGASEQHTLVSFWFLVLRSSIG